jgi:hypothetical protein
MGNTGLNKMASEYILNMNEKDMEDLNDVKKCNELIKSLAKTIEKKATISDVKTVFSQMQTNQRDITDVHIGIATFYVKIAHVYAVIMKTMNPTNSLCASRLFTHEPTNNGLSELDMLYNDFKYDLDSGEFKGRSNKMNKLYNANLENFYRAFTGSSMMDYTIKSFADIPITSYNKTLHSIKCENVDCLFEKYAINQSNGIRYASEAYSKLTNILEELFIKDKINPTLTEKKLADIVGQARKIIIELYIECETSYEMGVQLYEAISNKILLETLRGQQDELHNQIILLKIK